MFLYPECELHEGRKFSTQTCILSSVYVVYNWYILHPKRITYIYILSSFISQSVSIVSLLIGAMPLVQPEDSLSFNEGADNTCPGKSLPAFYQTNLCLVFGPELLTHRASNSLVLFSSLPSQEALVFYSLSPTSWLFNVPAGFASTLHTLNTVCAHEPHLLDMALINGSWFGKNVSVDSFSNTVKILTIR